MLASITPLGERGRGGHWSVTVIAFVIGASAAGALVGALAGAIGALALPAALSVAVRLAVLGAAAVAAVTLDSRGDAVPGPRRQVDERWLDQFRGWVYGLGYGAQLGAGVTTVVSSAATYLALLASLFVADAARGAVVMGCYGAIRGLSLLAAARVRSPQQLVALHAGLERGRRLARGGGLVVMVAIFAAALAGVVV